MLIGRDGLMLCLCSYVILCAMALTLANVVSAIWIVPYIAGLISTALGLLVIDIVVVKRAQLVPINITQMSATMQREIAKVKKVLHPNSRKTIAIAKKSIKISHRQKAKMAGLIKQNLIGEKMLWIQQHMASDVCPYTPELTADILLKYIKRNDQELEQIALKHSIGGKRSRQHASREDIIRMTKEREQEEFDTCGIEIPDILIPMQCQMLRNWNGELRLLPNFKFRRFGKKHLRDALQRIEKQSRALNKFADSAKTKGSKAESTNDNKSEVIEGSHRENKELNTSSSENIQYECVIDIE